MMRRVTRWGGYLVALIIGVLTADLAAQIIHLEDGTVASKVVIYDLAGAAAGFSNTQHNEDAAASSGDAGTMALGVRTAACGTALSGSANDYNPLQFDSNGNLSGL